MSEYTLWKVVATREGFYDQILRPAFEVFELLQNEDGSWPWLEVWVPKASAGEREILDQEGDQVLVRYEDKDGNPVHTDFAPDTGDQLLKRGPMRGETMRFGWMRRVPDETPCGLYPPGTDFWPGEARVVTPRRAAPGVGQPAPIKGSVKRPRQEAP